MLPVSSCTTINGAIRCFTRRTRAQNKVTMLNKTELREVTEIWVDAVLNVDNLDLRRMEALASLQNRRMGYPAAPIFPASVGQAP